MYFQYKIVYNCSIISTAITKMTLAKDAYQDAQLDFFFILLLKEMQFHQHW